MKVGLKFIGTMLLAGSVFAPGLALADQQTLIVNLVNEPATVDPHKQWNHDSYAVYRNIFDNMVTRSAAGEIVPQVATSWTNLSDSEIEFQIRDDIVFHNGKKLTPEDVAFSVKRITDPDFKSP